ncbi:AraC family transcriptional regulator [Paenibacillus ehimensis]|uniref:AraC family transcriptional regulator n=1 Tax=Paenibacillus ehimensis TaxID=79264 RepID=UPI002DBB5362|nr:AraC family transcriptional regulator [Paenibacillus ehimensis]MEC0210711.1 AraC family transcriptional regulator [Paenibacillus ehimensis]
MEAQSAKPVTEKPLAFTLRQIRYIETASEWADDPGTEVLRLTAGMLLLITGGKGHLRRNGRTERLFYGKCLLLSRNAPMEISSDADAPLKGYVVVFDVFRIEDSPSLETFPVRREAVPFEGEALAERFAEIERTIVGLHEGMKERGELQRFNRQLLFQKLLGTLWEDAERERAGKDSTLAIKRTIEQMEQACDEQWTRDRLAELAGLSPWHYSSLFKKMTGKTPTDYLTETRVNRAKEKLLWSDARIKDIAQSVGYSNEFYFSSRFKQVTGVSPTEFVKQQRGRSIARAYPFTPQLGSPASGVPQAGRGRVIGLFFEDYLTVLGLKPVLQFAWGTYYQRYLEPFLSGVNKLNVNRIDFEAVMRAEPDLILLGFPDWAEEGRFDRFTQIAPTYVFERAAVDWRETLRTVGRLTGQSARAEASIRRYEVLAAAARKQLEQAIGREKVALLRVDRRKRLLLYGGPQTCYTGPVLYGDLGLEPPELVRELAWGERSIRTISPDMLRRLDADHLFVVIDEEGRDQARQWMNGESWRTHPAVRRGQVYEVSIDVWMSFGMIAHERKIDDVLNALTCRA